MTSSSGSGSGSAAGGHKRHVGINPCLACTTELNRSSNGGANSSTGSKFDHFFNSRADRPEGFDAALIFTPRLGEEAEKQQGSMTAGVQQGSMQQVRCLAQLHEHSNGKVKSPNALRWACWCSS
jgi:hypothetical protein